MACTRSNINFAPNYRFDSGSFSLIIKLYSSVHYSMISYSNSSLPQFNRFFYKLVYSACAVKKTVFTMNMKMYEAVFFHISMIRGLHAKSRVPCRKGTRLTSGDVCSLIPHRGHQRGSLPSGVRNPFFRPQACSRGRTPSIT